MFRAITAEDFPIWLVVSTPLKNMKVSWDDDIPNLWKVIKFMFQTTNEPYMFPWLTARAPAKTPQAIAPFSPRHCTAKPPKSKQKKLLHPGEIHHQPKCIINIIYFNTLISIFNVF